MCFPSRACRPIFSPKATGCTRRERVGCFLPTRSRVFRTPPPPSFLSSHWPGTSCSLRKDPTASGIGKKHCVSSNLMLYVILLNVESHVFPAQCGFTALAVDVCHCVKSRQKNPFLCRSLSNVHSEITLELPGLSGNKE